MEHQKTNWNNWNWNACKLRFSSKRQTYNKIGILKALASASQAL